MCTKKTLLSIEERDIIARDASSHQMSAAIDRSFEVCQLCQVHSLESVDEAKGEYTTGQGARCQACWKLVAQFVRSVKTQCLMSMCQSPLTY